MRATFLDWPDLVKATRATVAHMSPAASVLAWFLLGGLVAAVVAALVREIAADGYGRRPGPESHPGERALGAYPAVRPPSSATALRGLRLLTGLGLYGAAIGLIVRAHLGVGPWDVLAQGVAGVTGVPFGVVTNGIGALVLVLWVPLRQRPGIGTVTNVLLVGTAAQVVLDLLPPVDGLAARIALLALGILLLAAATGLYVGAGLGAGPRDGLMLGLHRRGLPLWLARTLVEGAALLAGWVLGGDVGIGTVVFAVAIGPLCGVAVRLLAPSALERSGAATST
jgi:uncharacterized membrane protein YczE